MKIKKTRRTGKSRSDSEWIYGLNPVLEAITAGRKVRTLHISFSRHGRVSEIIKEADRREIPVRMSEEKFFERTFKKGHQGIAAEVFPKEYVPLDELLNIPQKRKEAALFVILDCIEDPRNLGAILRVADASAIHGIVVQSRRSVTLGSEVSKVSAGAVEYVPVSMVANIKHAIYKMKESGIIIVGTEAAAGKILWDVDFKVPLAIVIGSEGKGIRETVSKNCDILVSIPMQGKINSLNVSVALGIFSYEIMRQRSLKN